MKSNRVFTIVFFSILGVVLVLFFFLTSDGRKYNWRETYDPQSDQPYGTLFMRKLLESYATDGFVFNTKKPIHELLDSASGKKKSAYVIIAHSLYADSLDIKAMQNYLTAGNDVFLITPYLTDLSDAFHQADCSREIFTRSTYIAAVQANFYHPAFSVSKSYRFAFRINDKDVSYYWDYLGSSVLCDSVKSIVPLGYFDSQQYVNFFKIPYGRGNLFVHTNPVMFTNYFMVKERNTEYASSVFTHSTAKAIIWDEFSKVPSYRKNRNPYYNPLYFIMEQPSLQYAWWVMLVLALLYVFFAAKRRQRFVPVLEQKANTSLAFLTMVSSLHYHNQNHGNMARKKMRHFLHFIRTKYSLSTHKIDPEFIKKLSVKSQVSEQELELIFDQYQIIENFHNIDSQRLAYLYNAIQNFYNKAK